MGLILAIVAGCINKDPKRPMPHAARYLQDRKQIMDEYSGAYLEISKKEKLIVRRLGVDIAKDDTDHRQPILNSVS